MSWNQVYCLNFKVVIFVEYACLSFKISKYSSVINLTNNIVLQKHVPKLNIIDVNNYFASIKKNASIIILYS